MRPGPSPELEVHGDQPRELTPIHGVLYPNRPGVGITLAFVRQLAAGELQDAHWGATTRTPFWGHRAVCPVSHEPIARSFANLAVSGAAHRLEQHASKSAPRALPSAKHTGGSTLPSLRSCLSFPGRPPTQPVGSCRLSRGSRDPTSDELACQLDLTAERVRELRRVAREPLSLEQPSGDKGESQLGDFIEDTEAPGAAEIAAVGLLRNQLAGVLGSLTDREAEVIGLRYGLSNGQPSTLDEIGEIYGVTRERNPADRSQGPGQTSPSHPFAGLVGLPGLTTTNPLNRPATLAARRQRPRHHPNASPATG